MGDRVVGGEVADPAFHQRAARAYFVVKGHRVGGHLRIGDQPALQISSPGPDRRDTPNEPVHRKPVQSLLHGSSIDAPGRCYFTKPRPAARRKCRADYRAGFSTRR